MTFIDKHFILIKDNDFKVKVIEAGFSPIYDQGDICIFKNTEDLKTFCINNIPAEKYICTNTMMI